MSDVRLIIREENHDWSGIIHGSSADRAIAALSADPATLEDMEAAYARYAVPTPGRSFFANFSRGLCDEPYDAGIVVIDLFARLVFVESTYCSANRVGAVCYHDGLAASEKRLRYHLADEWLLISDSCEWRVIAEERRRERAARPPLDVREVLYGRPMLEFVARETFAAFARRQTVGAHSVQQQPDTYRGQNDQEIVRDTIKQIHAAWLLTPRDELHSACPRDVALERHNSIERDLQDQRDRWSVLDECPPGLDESSFAFRYGGFGTHELVQYYDLVRELLWSCWERLVEMETERAAANGLEVPSIGDFLSSEVRRLESVREEWFDRPDPEFHGRTPRSIIDRERARLPEVMCRHDILIDADCPCCQMLADMPGPTFWHLDGCNMDDDFAFDFHHATREEWEAERSQWEEHYQRCEAARSQPGAESAGSSGFSVTDGTDATLSVRLFAFGCQLANLVSEIRDRTDRHSTPAHDQQLIDQLNRDFGNLRELLLSSETSVAEALIDPVLDRFAESLATVSHARPNLAANCESLASALAKLFDTDLAESTWESDDLDIPF